MVNISGFLCHRREADPRRHIVWMRLMSEVRDTEAGVRDQVIKEGRPRSS